MAEIKPGMQLSGWGVFAGLLMIMVGVFQGFFGIVALFNTDYYVVTPNALLFVNVTTWGWIHLLFGLLLVLAGISLLGGGMFGRVIAIILAMLSAIANLIFLPVAPLWAIIVITLDVFIIYALTVNPVVPIEE
jgi:hypothetical protein